MDGDFEAYNDGRSSSTQNASQSKRAKAIATSPPPRVDATCQTEFGSNDKRVVSSVERVSQTAKL